ncbi:RNA-directed DNA polymerase [Priestia megaterium]|uniref:RNA-directed DNA polymerase n=1 Tax=Priestia megaterium TaxID=1404 RepID=A0ABD4X2E7_PRIMG|nr:RNA-directed DNA polymerase [Priestia megaterium]MDD9786685.1 RNA-directed DNA polymerase [Priestia megaterium]
MTTASTSNLTITSLMEKGYFPSELISEFTTKPFAGNIDSINFSQCNKKVSKTIDYSIPRVTHARRKLDIPNPLHQYKLAQNIVNHWSNINSFISQSTLSLTKPIIKDGGKRALERENSLKDRVKYKIHNSIGKGYVLKTDISRYYSTIYTHSIPWALHGKSVAKANHGHGLYGNILDTAVRNTQDRQSIGIPIGPDTSLVLAEIIGTAIDLELQNAIPNIKGTRYIDDFELYFNTESEAKEAFSQMDKIVKSFQLDWNPNKYHLISIPDKLEPIWVSEMKCYKVRDSNALQQYYDLISYFNKAFICSKDHPNEAVLKYCVKRLAEKKIHAENWDIFESFLLNVASIDSSTLPLVKVLFHTYEWHYQYEINKDKIEDFLHQFISGNIKTDNNYEVAWALSLAKSMNLELNDILVTELFNFNDPICSVILLDMLHLGTFTSTPDLTRIESLLNAEELYGHNWLLAYEGGLIHSGLPEYIENDSFFSQLSNQSISFYDPTINDIKREMYENQKEESFKEMIQAAYENDNGY